MYNDTVPVESDRRPEEGYHFTQDVTDHATEWVPQQKALMPDKPFFMYWAPGATDAPHHVPEEWWAKYKGRFGDGWDAQRERTFARLVDTVDDLGTPEAVQPLRRRLGPRRGHPVPVDQADRIALAWHAQRHHRALAGWHRGCG